MQFADTQKNSMEISAPSRIAPLIGVGLVILGIAAYVFFGRGLMGDARELKTDVAEKESQLEILNQKIVDFKKAEQELDLDTQVKKFDILRSVPEEIDQDEVIRDIISTAEAYDIELNSIGFGRGASSEENIGALRINASFEGNYNDLTSFLEGLEQNGRLFKVNSINVQLDTLEISNVQRAVFSLSIDSFYQE